MKYLAIALLLFATPATAATVYGTVTHIEPVYSEAYINVPQTVCYEVQVPVTRQVGVNTGNVIAGAIIGGAIGNQFGNGSGNDAATVLGAILGANSAANYGYNQQVVTGYQIQQQCDTQYVTEVQSTVSSWIVYYRWNNLAGSFNTNLNYVIGERVKLRVGD